jgi:general secretion pathway protein A
VHRLSHGIPRLINLICDRALLAGYVHGTRTISAPMIEQAAREACGTSAPRFLRPAYAALGGGAALLLALAALWLLPGATPVPAGVAAGSAPGPAAATAAGAPLGVGSVAAAAGPGAELEASLVGAASEGSLGNALEQIRALWGPGPLEATAFRAHLDQLRRLDLPVAVELFHPARRDTTYLALVGLHGDTALLAAADGARLRVRVSELDRYWTREASALWRDLDGVLAHSDPAWPASWARSELDRHGYGVGAGGLTEAVVRFQAARDLAPDGVVGRRTLMTLYSLRSEPRPRLSAGFS